MASNNGNTQFHALASDVKRRHFLKTAPVALGAIAAGQLAAADSPMAVRPAPQAARAKNVIFLFMAGAPSQLDLFEPKPLLNQFHGDAPPASYTEGRRFAFLKPEAKLLGTKRKFAQYGDSGMWLSDLLPCHREIVDDVTWVRSLRTEVFNHGPAKLFMNTGFQAPGRPSLGSWVTYGLGSESNDLPGFVVLQSGPRGPRAGNTLWSSGFLPTSYQGVPFRGKGAPILHLDRPEGMSVQAQRDFIDTVGGLNRMRADRVGDPEIETRVQAYETAFRMQSSAPELMEIQNESKETLDLYGVEPGESSFAANCLLARRLVERGTRFVQLYHTDWDHHGGKGSDIEVDLPKRAKEVDRASAALVLDLKRRGLLDDTLVIWGGEFGRTPMGEERDSTGRDHHVDAFTMWMAGGGTKPGLIHGQTDELGFGIVEGEVHVHDFHATILHLLGFDHERFTFRSQGRDFRLTDVHGHVVEELLA